MQLAALHVHPYISMQVAARERRDRMDDDRLRRRHRSKPIKETKPYVRGSKPIDRSTESSLAQCRFRRYRQRQGTGSRL
jgi:hypothetical protein